MGGICHDKGTQPQEKFWLWSHCSSLFPSVKHFSELHCKYFYKPKCLSWSLTFQEGKFYILSAGFLLLALPLARHLANCRAIVQGSMADGRLWTCPSPVGASVSSQYREKAGKLGPSLPDSLELLRRPCLMAHPQD